MLLESDDTTPYTGPHMDHTQGCSKTRVFHQKPSPVGLTGLNRV